MTQCSCGLCLLPRWLASLTASRFEMTLMSRWGTVSFPSKPTRSTVCVYFCHAALLSNREMMQSECQAAAQQTVTSGVEIARRTGVQLPKRSKN